MLLWPAPAPRLPYQPGRMPLPAAHHLLSLITAGGAQVGRADEGNLPVREI